MCMPGRYGSTCNYTSDQIPHFLDIQVEMEGKGKRFYRIKSSAVGWARLTKFPPLELMLLIFYVSSLKMIIA